MQPMLAATTAIPDETIQIESDMAGEQVQRAAKLEKWRKAAAILALVASRECVNRVFACFKKHGYIETRRNSYILLRNL